MQTFYIEKENRDGETLRVTGDVCRHLTKALRIRVGESLRFSDGENYYEGDVTEIAKDAVSVAVRNLYAIDDEPKTEVTLIQCLPRGDKMDQILQKTTELGVSAVIPVESDHSQVRLKGKTAEKKRRWQKIVNAAAEQCGRGRIPEVKEPCSLREALALLDADTEILFCHEREKQRSFRETAREMKARSSKIAVLIGPEGGFSEGEAERILNAGGKPVTMGRRILRTETAGPTALAVLMYEFDEWEAAHGN